MSIHSSVQAAEAPRGDVGLLTGYLEALSLIERLHRLLLDVIKDEFERVGVIEINAVQALLLFNVGVSEWIVLDLKKIRRHLLASTIPRFV